MGVSHCRFASRDELCQTPPRSYYASGRSEARTAILTHDGERAKLCKRKCVRAGLRQVAKQWSTIWAVIRNVTGLAFCCNVSWRQSQSHPRALAFPMVNILVLCQECGNAGQPRVLISGLPQAVLRLPSLPLSARLGFIVIISAETYALTGWKQYKLCFI